jgi:hypothetical protein
MCSGPLNDLAGVDGPPNAARGGLGLNPLDQDLVAMMSWDNLLQLANDAISVWREEGNRQAIRKRSRTNQPRIGKEFWLNPGCHGHG